MKRESIDLHMHTVCSDGTDSPGELILRVKEAGIGLFSATDHDTLKCADVIPSLLKPGDPAFIAGAEFSCRDELGKYHILGYGFDPEAAAIRAAAERGHAMRMKKLEARLELLKTQFGFEFPEEEIGALKAMDNPGKPHIAAVMVKCGYAKTGEEAIHAFIDRLRYAGEYMRPEEAIRCVSESGGIPVLAHPAFGDGDQHIDGEELDKRVRRLTELGLKGMECFYSGFGAALRAEALRIAERNGLYVTCGSDYHGQNKPVRPGDTGLDTEREYPDGLKRFLRDISSRGHTAPKA